MQESLGSTPDGPANISLREYFDILRRRRAIILQTFAVVLVIGVLVNIYTNYVYKASGRLLLAPTSFSINQVNTSDPLADIFQSNQQYSTLTQVQMLQSAEVRKRVQDKIGNKQMPLITVQPVEGTQIIDVFAEGEDANVVGLVPSYLMNAYKDQQKESNNKRVLDAYNNARGNVQNFSQRLDNVERAIRKFKQDNKISELDKNKEYLLEQSGTAAQALFNAGSQVRTLAARMTATRTKMAEVGKTTGTVVSIESDPTLQSLDNQLVMLDAERARAAEDYAPSSVTMRRIDAQSGRLTQQRAALIKNFVARTQVKNPIYEKLAGDVVGMSIEADAAALNVKGLNDQYDKIQKQLAAFPEMEQRWSQLQAEKLRVQNLLNIFQTSQSNLELRKAVDKPLPVIMSDSSPPTAPIRPDRLRNILFAGLLGIFLGLCLALLQELFDDRINSPEEAERALRVPNLGIIPLIEESGLRLIKDTSSFSPLMESYRTLRTNLNFAAVGRPVRSLVVTSAMAAEGKSTTVANLAMAMALDNKRVIIVDADLRRPSLHKLFKVDVSPGLTDVLVETHTLEQVIRPTPTENVMVITAGSMPPNPAELLGSAAMGHLMAELEAHADIVLFDSPPVLAVADSVVLASRANGVLLVIGFGETKKASSRKALDMLGRANANVLGTALNRLEGPGAGYYYYGKYYVPVADRPKSGATPAAAGTERPALTQGELKTDGTKTDGKNED